jgi:hypothetical protein
MSNKKKQLTTNNKSFTTDNKQRTTNKRIGTPMRLKICVVVFFSVFIFTQTAFAIQYTFHPRISATGEYTSNRDLSKNDEKDDFITVISPGFTAQMLGKISGLEVSYDPSYAIYEDSSDDNQLRHNANLRAWTAPSKNTNFRLNNNFFLTEDPEEREEIIAVEEGEVGETRDTTVRKRRRKYYRNTANARLSYQFGKDDSMYAGFLHSILRNNDSQTEDSDRYSPSVGLNYWFGPKFGFQSNATYTRGEFDQDRDFIGEGTDDFDNFAGDIRFIFRTKTRFSVFTQYNHAYRKYDGNDNNDYMAYAPSAGFTYVVEKGLNLRLGLGYYYQEVDNDDDNQSWFSNSQIAKIWDYRRGSINLTGLTGVTQTNFGAQNIGLERFAAVQSSANYAFFKKITGDINGLYRYSDVIGDSDQEDVGEKVNRYRAGAGLSYKATRWMNIRLGYTFNKVDSDNSEDNYDEHRGLLSITLSPDKPFRHID